MQGSIQEVSQQHHRQHNRYGADTKQIQREYRMPPQQIESRYTTKQQEQDRDKQGYRRDFQQGQVSPLTVPFSSRKLPVNQRKTNGKGIFKGKGRREEDSKDKLVIGILTFQKRQFSINLVENRVEAFSGTFYRYFWP